MKTAIYPGSFDPVTMGHLDIIERASRIFDMVIVLVAGNSGKSPLFSPEERVNMLRVVCRKLKNVKIDAFDGLLVDYALKFPGCVIVKGMRAISDFEHEFQMALINNSLRPELDTLFLTTSHRYQFLSSSVVREVGWLGGDISEFVPPAVMEQILDRLRERGGQNAGQC